MSAAATAPTKEKKKKNARRVPGDRYAGFGMMECERMCMLPLTLPVRVFRFLLVMGVVAQIAKFGVRYLQIPADERPGGTFLRIVGDPLFWSPDRVFWWTYLGATLAYLALVYFGFALLIVAANGLRQVWLFGCTCARWGTNFLGRAVVLSAWAADRPCTDRAAQSV